MKALRLVGIAVLALGLGACASAPGAHPSDPLESWNRGVWRFNDAVDRAVLKPVATVYQDHVPGLVRQGVGNFFANLQDAWTAVNSVLQLKGQAAAESFTRFWVNSFFGLAGVLDVASEMQIPRHNEDFGQTLGHWGVGAGPYLVLPLLGPSTLRDTTALPADWRGDLVTHVEDPAMRASLLGLRIVHRRAGLLKQEGVMEQAALDRYVFMRDAYLQYRRNLVYDGNPPEEPPQEERYDEEPATPSRQPAR